GSHFAAIRIMQWLALSAIEAGQLRLAHQESLAALDLIEQTASYALLKGYFKDVLAIVLYQWNRLEEARSRLRTVIQDAATWQQSDLLLSGYIRLMQVELARGDLSAVQQALHEFEQLEGYQGYHHWSWLPIMRAQWWLAQGQMKEAADWAVSIVFPEGAWERSLYDAFPVVMRVYFAELRWTEALELLDRFSGGLDRPANIMITLTYLAQYLVALHHAGQNEQAHEVAARLFALTEPEGYLRLQSGDRPDPGDRAAHRQKTRQQPARQTGSHQPHPGDCPGACPLPALTRFLPTCGLPPHTTTPFGILLTTVEWLAFCYALPRAVFRNGDLPLIAFPSTALRSETRRMRRRQMYYAIRVQGHLDLSWQD